MCKDDELLTAEEEKSLAERIKNGDKEARDVLVCKNQRLVKMVAYKYINACSGLDIDDLCQAGNIGLLNAVEKFDVEKGFRFSTYATWWIKQAITREIMDKGNIVHIPVHVHEKLRAVRRAITEIEQKTGLPATAKEIAVVLNESEDKITAYIDLLTTSSHVSIDKPVGEDESTTIMDMIPDFGMTPQDIADAIQVREAIEQVIEQLQPREQAVLKMRFGFTDGNTHTLEEVGDAYGVTRERVRQIESKAIRKLRRPGIGALLKSFLD